MKLVQFLFLSTLMLTAEACMKFKYFNDEKTIEPEGIWDEVSNPRNIISRCECGHRPNGDLPWNVFVHVVNTYDYWWTGKERICTGTIIASNLILTSHKCLTFEDSRMNFFDIFKPKSETQIGNIHYSTKDIKVTENFAIKGSGKVFQVKEIIYNGRYALTSSFDKAPVDDLVILKVSTDFTSTSRKQKPICIPDDETFKNVNLLDARGVYYGAGETADYPLRKGASLELPIYYPSGDKCSTEYNDGKGVVLGVHSKKLCSGFLISAGNRSPKQLGAPLLVSPNNVSYLIGLSINVSKEGAYENIVFTNILSMVKYLEHHAKIHKSRWCKSPSKKVDFSKNNFLEGELFRKQDVPPYLGYPWDDPSKSYTREETLDCRCGIAKYKNSSARIAGGIQATPYEFPWMVSLSITDLQREVFGCGGTIINDKMILTAAHCVFDELREGLPDPIVPAEDIEATVNIHRYYDDKHAITVPVKQVHVHPNYAKFELNDIALLELDTPLPFGDTYPVRPICLPNPNKYLPVVGKMATAAGWGDINPDTGEDPEYLQKVELPILNFTQFCGQFHIQAGNVPARHDGIPYLCVGYLNRWFDSAAGDSGGPLKIYVAEKKRWFQVGIVSFGVDDDLPKIFPDPKFAPKDYATATIYEDVQRYQKFIDYHSNMAGAKWCKSG